MHTLGLKNFGQENVTPSNLIRGSFEVKSTADILHNTAQTVGRNRENYDSFKPSFNATMDVRDGSMHELCHKSNYQSLILIVPKGMPTSVANMMTVRGQYKTKVPLNTKRIKKKDSSTTFRKIINKNCNYLTVSRRFKSRLLNLILNYI